MTENKPILPYAPPPPKRSLARILLAALAIASIVPVIAWIWLTQAHELYWTALGGVPSVETRWGYFDYLSTNAIPTGGIHIRYGRLAVTILISLFLLSAVWFAALQAFKYRHLSTENHP